MKYKCTEKYCIEDVTIMKEGDIVVIKNNDLYNVTTGLDYRNITDLQEILSKTVSITDDFVPNSISDIDRFKSIINQMFDTFKRKNHDYGNSFEQSLDEEGLAAARIRLGDKWNRFKTLSKSKDIKVNDESLKDTLLDTANYCIMTAMWLDKQM